MAFIQIIDFHTDNIEEGRKLVEDYRAKTKGTRTSRRGILTADRDEKDHYVNLVFFDSYESAMENSKLPETQELSEGLMALGKGQPKFLNLEILDDLD